MFIVGFKGTGKTSLIEALIGELRRRGLSVGTIKHTVGSYFIDTPGKDTWRHRKAGAQASALLTQKDSAVFLHRPLDLHEAIRLLGPLDLVLVEGFKKLDVGPRIIVARDKGEVERLINGLEVAVTGDVARSVIKELSIPVLDLDAIDALANIVEEKAMPLLPGLNCGKCGYSSCRELMRAVLAGEAEAGRCVNLPSKEVHILVDGSPIKINPFVGRILRNVVIGIVSTLKGVGVPKCVEVKFTVERTSQADRRGVD